MSTDLPLLSKETMNKIYKDLVDLKDMYNEYLKTNRLGYRINHRKFKEFINKVSSGELWSGDLSKFYD